MQIAGDVGGVRPEFPSNPYTSILSCQSLGGNSPCLRLIHTCCGKRYGCWASRLGMRGEGWVIRIGDLGPSIGPGATPMPAFGESPFPATDLLSSPTAKKATTAGTRSHPMPGSYFGALKASVRAQNGVPGIGLVDSAPLDGWRQESSSHPSTHELRLRLHGASGPKRWR